ncbi:maltose alpha-D-glucosyltransferase/alpha-amylase [Winogradskyella wandonensis]|uniref:Maltose alpha-D-glucosyltransferase/alpha-amylase n=1 Tax=Winogradskyella wandonensis TaxID=1442586 RepID=A0A4R1KV67_9FLAO|nr:trehalose synthase [Winogradskyella wandonensis]TCK69075.1 maltose alpha-D-glucosyltransferase/alpha-amylase [Winogradskyella wandonensis]
MAKKSSSSKIQKTALYNFDTRWEELMENKDFVKVFLSDVLEDYIIKQRWYGGKASKLKYIELAEYFRIQQNEEVYYGLILEVNFVEAFYQHYFLPIAFVSDENFAQDDRILPISIQNQEGFIIDAINLEAFRKVVFERILTAVPNDTTRVQYNKSLLFKDVTYESSRFMGFEQSNTSIVYNEKFVLKFFRRIYADRNPDYEMSRFLSEKKEFKNTPAYLGSIQIKDNENINITIGLMQEMVENDGDAWEYMLSELHKVFSNLEYKSINVSDLPRTEDFLRLDIRDVPPQIIDWAGLNIFTKIQKLAKRTAEMHIALGSEFEDTAFTPTRFNNDYTVWLKNRLLYQFQNRLNTVENNLHKLDGLALELANEFLDKKNEIRKRFVSFDWTKLKSERLRVHGDYHLGQLLVKGDDFYILDFEGEPESTIRDRKVKQPPLKDVAGMFRSFHYAIYATIFNNIKLYKHSQVELFEAGEILYQYLVGVFLGTYVYEIQEANINIGYNQERIFLLKYSLLEKAVYELGYELNSRPRWAVIPLKGISNIINN